MRKLEISCGTLVVDALERLLLCHVTGTRSWDIPKGVQEPGETALAAAVRELREETGLVYAPDRFVELGRYAYRPVKSLHLFRLEVGASLPTLELLACESFFPHHASGKPTPEADGFCWATREQVGRLCWPRMAALLLEIGW